MFLVVYVDDFKLAGPKALMKECWDPIRRGTRTDDPFPVGKHVECDHKTSQRLDPKSGAKLRDDMSDFMRSCIDRYVELAGVDRSSLRKVCTPFLAEPREPSPARDPTKSGDDLNSPAIEPDGGIDAARGRLQPIAARVLMKVLYGARMARYDLLRAVNGLATEITQWTPRCDMRLHRLMGYICHTLVMELYGWVGDKAESLCLDLFVDADLAGETQSCKSTSGVFFAVCGPNSRWPITGQSKRQPVTSHCTPESGIVAYSLGLRTIGPPAIFIVVHIAREKWRRSPIASSGGQRCYDSCVDDR